MKVGSLVRTCPDTDYTQTGIVVGITDDSNHSLWFGTRIIHVVSPENGEELMWDENALELIQ